MAEKLPEKLAFESDYAEIIPSEDTGDFKTNLIRGDFYDSFIVSNKEDASVVERMHAGLFHFLRDAVFTFFAVVVGTPYVAIMAVLYGIASFVVNYIVVSAMRLAQFLAQPALSFLRFFVRGVLDPFYESAGRVFSMVRVKLTGSPRLETSLSV
eukprot:CAMPEP_0201488208 /NCGR_PEP_ID=MMETSP0151_2-20130828/17682_1 /ASSEMBLY_ACC=CAM_ASM_000257 /TAXON_ID=200890 /ORGANISM="Paramoeba atlantica, Strain 621/1 / CCAP 1560/9" /LENGTH=153 /DNA_ID=CAMNT_0047873455 /DNA_START=29 /DNA_END=490 /DNA_ORIENTATION=+